MTLECAAPRLLATWPCASAPNEHGRGPIRLTAIRIAGDRAMVRDWGLDDAEPLRELLHPDACWHDTSGLYFGRPDSEQVEQVRQAFLATAAIPHEQLPTPRASLAEAARQDNQFLSAAPTRRDPHRRNGLRLWRPLNSRSDPSTRGRGIGLPRVWST